MNDGKNSSVIVQGSNNYFDKFTGPLVEDSPQLLSRT